MPLSMDVCAGGAGEVKELGFRDRGVVFDVREEGFYSQELFEDGSEDGKGGWPWVVKGLRSEGVGSFLKLKFFLYY